MLGHTSTGLTGSQIGNLLVACGFSDPGDHKKGSNLESLRERQSRENSGNNVANFILRVMDPVRYRGQRDVFDERRHDLNVALAFAGLQVREDGKLEGVALATTLTEAAQRASRLRSELMRRGISGEVLRYCQPELLEGDYFHAVFEATKSIAQNRLAREPRGRTRPPSCLTQVRWSDPFFARAPLLVCGRHESGRSRQRRNARATRYFAGRLRLLKTPRLSRIAFGNLALL